MFGLTVMQVSFKATISGFTMSRSFTIFSFPLMKPHFGAERQQPMWMQMYLTRVALSNINTLQTCIEHYPSSSSFHPPHFCLSPSPIKDHRVNESNPCLALIWRNPTPSKINVLGVLLTSSSGTGGSGMGMSKGAWREERSVMQKSSSWVQVKGYCNKN